MIHPNRFKSMLTWNLLKIVWERIKEEIKSAREEDNYSTKPVNLGFFVEHAL